jgi:chromosome segregation ATPase
MSGEATDDAQDAPHSDGLPSGEEGRSTSTEERTYTAKELSDIKAAEGRKRKALEQEKDDLANRLKEQSEKLTQLEEQMRKTRMEQHKDNPDQLKRFETEWELEKKHREYEERERELQRQRKELERQQETINQRAYDITVNALASRYNMPADEIKDLGISDTEKLEKVVQRLAKATTRTDEDFTPDSGAMAGGSSELTPASVDKMSVEALTKKLYKR